MQGSQLDRSLNGAAALAYLAQALKDTNKKNLATTVNYLLKAECELVRTQNIHREYIGA